MALPLYLVCPGPNDLAGASKARLARPNTILIDDSDANVTAYREACCPAILVPRPWNSRYAEADRASEVVQCELKDLMFTEVA